MLTAREKFFAAIAKVADEKVGLAPYFGAALRGFVRRETPGLGTLAVTKTGILLYDFAFVESISLDELALALIHEVHHVILKHHERAEALGILPEASPEMGTKAFLANLAMDACINEGVRKAWDTAPKTWVYPEGLGQPENLIFEDRYLRLLKEYEKQKKQGQGKDGKGKLGHGRCGSCAGNPVDGEPQDGSSKKSEGRSAADMERIRREVAEGIKQHAATKGRGTVPGELERWADEYLAPPKIDWREKLAQIVRGAVAFKMGYHDLDWGRPSRRQAGLGYGPGRPVVPAFRSPVPRVAVAIDTSGSMGPGDLTAALVELNGVLAAVGAEVDFVACDAEVHVLRPVRNIEEAAKSLRGGGGTDMRPVFSALEAQRPQAEVVIVATDGHIGDGYPASEPDFCKTIWVVIGSQGNAECCPWGEIVRVEEAAA